MQLRVCLEVMLSTACAPSKSCLHKCVAAKSGDARDKYFAVAAGSFDPAAGAQLRSESSWIGRS